jgi:hypothetical protein
MSLPNHPDLYRPHVQSEFRLHAPGGPARTLALTAVHAGIDDEVQLSFSLHFTGPGERLEQGTYPIEHPVLGHFDLFLVPIRRKSTGIVYEAVFNLLRDETQ